jgi:glycosyltransferase involved in cell wall biosynthesis
LNNSTKLICLNRYFHPDQSATSQLLTDLAFDLAQDHEVHILTSRQRYDDPTVYLPPYEVVNQVQIHRVWTSHFGRQRLLGRALDYLSFYLTAAWQLWRLARSGDVIIVKTDPPLMSIIASPIAKWRGAILVNWLQDIFPEIAVALGVIGKPGRMLQFLQWLRNRSLVNAKQNVVLGERMANYLSSLGIPQSQITVIPNWADGQAIQPLAAENNPLRTEWQLQDKFVVGYSGNLGRAHEFTTILEAAAQLINNSRIVFLFIGSGPQKRWLETEVTKRHLTNVLFQPYQPRERLGDSLTIPDVHLISLRPSLEGLIVPSKFYGIAAAGRPVLYLGDKEGEIPRLLRLHQCGMTLAEGDSQGLVEVIKRLAETPEERLQLGRNARTLFEQHFEKALALQEWRRVLEANQGITPLRGVLSLRL